MVTQAEIFSLIQSKYDEISPHLLKTPLYTSSIASNLYIKAENVQYTGSFKLRGAASKLTEVVKQGHSKVITASTGNHGLAVATLCSKLGLMSTIFVPESITKAKEEKLTVFNIELKKIPGDSERSEISARQYAEEEGIPFVSPYNDQLILAGQGSIAIELEQQTELDDIERIYVTIGGGGMISGIGSYLKTKYPHIEIVGCQPENSAVMYHSVKAGKVISIEHQPTISDGSAGGMEENSITFDLHHLIDRFILVPEDDIHKAMHKSFIHHNSIIEGAAGVALAGFLQDQETGTTATSIVIWCGGNISPHRWYEVMEEFTDAR